MKVIGRLLVSALGFNLAVGVVTVAVALEIRRGVGPDGGTLASDGGGAGKELYIANGGGEKTVSHAILGGTPNHGVWAVPIEGLSDRSEFAGHGPFLSALNAPKNATVLRRMLKDFGAGSAK